VCIKLVVIRMKLHQDVALSFKKVGDPARVYLQVKNNHGGSEIHQKFEQTSI